MHIGTSVSALLVIRALLADEMPKLARAAATLIVMPLVFSPYFGLPEGVLVAYGTLGLLFLRRAVRDDDAAFMMEHFYETLRAGGSVAAALREARHHAIEAGLPAAAWAGIAALGDGRYQPITARPEPDGSRRWSRAIVITLVIGGAVWIRRRRGVAATDEGVPVR
jgi:hypothetical protein